MVTPTLKITFTLLCYITIVLTLVSVSHANLITPEKRDHVYLNRMIKKRQFSVGDVLNAGKRQVDLGAIGAGAAPPTFPSTTPTPTADGTDGTSSSASPATSTPSSTSTDSPATSLPASNSQTNSLSQSQSASSSSASSSSSSASSSSSSSTHSTSSTPTQSPTQVNTQPTVTPQAADAPLTSSGPVTSTVTDASAATGISAAASSSSTSKTTKTTLIVIVGIAASIGGVVVLWTIIRKWKFKPSANFEDRMQPINWQPTGPDDRDVPGVHRSASVLSHGSFHSSGHENPFASGYGSDHGHGSGSLQPIPDHDFTAGPATLAPVGGYANLARGPSPQPQMSEQLTRAPTLSQPNYEYGVPLHHQGGGRY